MPLYDWECSSCELIFEWMAKMSAKSVKCPLCWDEDCKKVWTMGKSPSFKLTYNAQTDSCDWDGNRSQYWDAYKKTKHDGTSHKMRIPKHDGDG